MFRLFTRKNNGKTECSEVVNTASSEKDMNQMNDYFEITIAGCTRRLKKFPVNDKIDIAAFILFGDVEITEKSAEALLAKLPEFDMILTPEAKSIPLAYEMSRQSGKKYIVARKGLKVYMGNALSVDDQSITTKGLQKLYLGEDDAAELKGKKVVVLDDVISTGGSLNAAVCLAEQAGCEIVAKCAVLSEGDANDRDDIIVLGKLPLFFK